MATAWAGVGLSLLAVVTGGSFPIFCALWVLYGSFVRLGDPWFSFGWEIQLLETGVLAALLAPPFGWRARQAPPVVAIILFRWLAFRIFFGAGLIKLRGDACWRALTCLDYHFETQPLPNPLSPWFHHLPHVVLAGGVLFNHFVELIAPFLLFLPRRLRLVGATAMVAFQLTLIVSGNLAFLNWLTLIPLVACFDDDALAWVLPRRRPAPAVPPTGRAQRVMVALFAVVVAIRSVPVIDDLLSRHQAMNTSYDRLALVNTYGAFGSIDRVRRELVIEGTADPSPGPATEWRAYELPCKPGALDRRPCVLGPYHLRLDWLIWFAAMTDDPGESPWLIHFVWQLLDGDPGIRRLLAVDPFAGAAPRFIRIRRFDYHFAKAGPAWWTRDHETLFLPPVPTGSPELRDFLASYGWQ